MLPERERPALGDLDGGNVVVVHVANEVLPVLVIDVAGLARGKREDGPGLTAAVGLREHVGLVF